MRLSNHLELCVIFALFNCKVAFLLVKCLPHCFNEVDLKNNVQMDTLLDEMNRKSKNLDSLSTKRYCQSLNSFKNYWFIHTVFIKLTDSVGGS